MNRQRQWLAAMAMVLAMLAAGTGWANNLTITNVTVTPNDNTTAYIKFDISWENSWRYTNINHDAAWVFFKFQQEGQTAWNHVILEANQVVNPAGYSVGSGTALDFIVPTNKVGLFVRRQAEGAGTIESTNVQVPWNFTSNNLSRNARVIVQACGVEMVYVAQGSFKAGSGASIDSEFYKSPNTTDPYPITNENAITVGTAAGNLYYTSNYAGDKGGPIPAEFPKGYNAFYCMKYEITQGQYRDFLNALTRDQQVGRSRSLVADRFCMSDTASISYRNSIRCPSDIPAAPEPVVFGCDFDGDKTFNESNDGMDLACNYLQGADMLAFAAWAGLRPMSELEYEKACRGPLDPMAGEYAWGNLEISATTAMGTTDGTGTNRATGGNCNYGSCSPDGPYRVGIYATTNSSRVAAGASYWGIMELSGNVGEFCVNVGAFRTFTGLHGNGALSSAGTADYSSLVWPSNIKGRLAGWNDASSYQRASERSMSNYYSPDGGRAVRTAPVEVTP